MLVMGVLHDPDAEESVVILLFDSEDDYRRGVAVLSAMPGRRHAGAGHGGMKMRRRDHRV